ncbi:LysR family transcriptional regulator [Paenibacillus paeoniae]|uniref:LysR family transcriptional regulator n=1 Tax=Paenibacillus paeoniae TaxID=2292705 RepID=A0A371PL97_9BACL|nr:LysR family transcriptional regulator [Paenibacillus paeoniae]REK76980.1 LysR family transcriptional regulator [Paenibacillus paeoniae]
MINLEWYRIFLQTAKYGNLTKAAQQLHITQPSVSYAIKQMEQALGLKLFHRQSKGVSLTEEGKALLAYVEQSFSLLDAGQHYIREMKQLNEGELRIGASDSLIKHVLLPYLNQYHQQYPGIRIRLSHGKSPDIASRLKDGLLDCGIVHMPLSDPMLHIQELASFEHCFVVGDALKEWSDRMLASKELVNLPLLMLSPGSSTRNSIDQWLMSRGLEIKPDFELGSVDLLMEFAMLGYGAAFINRSVIQEEVRAGKLFELRLEEALPSRSIGLAVRRDMNPSVAADRFIHMLRDHR